MAGSAPRAVAIVVGLQFVSYLVGYVCGKINGELWHVNQLPDVLVVRRVDYNHYLVEQQHYLLMPLVQLAVTLTFARHMPASQLGLTTFVLLSGTAGVFAQEAMLQITGERNMSMEAFAMRAPSPVAVALHALVGLGVPIAARKAVAILWQGFLEGGIYFTQPFLTSAWAISSHPKGFLAAVLFVGWQWSFRTASCAFHGWPQPVVIGNPDVLSKRAIFSTLAFRVPQLACIAILLRTPRWRKRWLPMATAHFCFVSYYFWMLRFMGRSYLELRRGGIETLELDDTVAAPPLWIEVVCTTIRILEPIMGGATCMLNAMVGLESMEGAGGGGAERKETEDKKAN